MHPIMPAVAERTPLLPGRQSDDDYKRSSYTNQQHGDRQAAQQQQPYHYSYPASGSASPSSAPSASSSYQSQSQSAPSSPFSPRRLPPAGQSAAQDAVRRNLLTFLAEHLQLCLALTFLLPQLMAITAVLTTHWDTETCDQPLHGWAVVYGIRIALSLFLAVVPFLPGRVSRPLSAVLLSPSATQLLHIFSFVWFILGNYWLFHSTDCQSTAPAVFQLVSALLLLNCVLLFLLLLLFLLFCPFLYFCAPWIIRLIILLQDMTRERRGLPAEVIQLLPSLTYPEQHRWHQSRGGVTAVEREIGEEGEEGAGEGENDRVWPAECSICLSDFSVGDKCRLLGCHPTHVFHAACIDNWLQLNASCPICRQEVDVRGMTRGAANRGRVESSEEARRRRAENMV